MGLLHYCVRQLLLAFKAQSKCLLGQVSWDGRACLFHKRVIFNERAHLWHPFSLCGLLPGNVNLQAFRLVVEAPLQNATMGIPALMSGFTNPIVPALIGGFGFSQSCLKGFPP